MKKKKLFRKIAFVLVVSLICTLMPLGNSNEKFYAATAGEIAFSRMVDISTAGGIIDADHDRLFYNTYTTRSNDFSALYDMYCYCHSYDLRFLGWVDRIPTCTEGGWMYVGCNQSNYLGSSTCTYTVDSIGQAYDTTYNGQIYIPAFGHNDTKVNSLEVITDGYKSTYCTYCGWRKGTEAATYTVTFDGNGGTTSTGATQYTQEVSANGENLTNTLFKKTGYNFAGWTDGTYTYSDGQFYTPSQSITLSALWSAKTPTLTFSANGGSVWPNSKTVTYANTYGDLPTPTRTGYQFLGWFDALEGGNQIVSTTQVTNYNDHYIYAHWEAIPYTVTYDANGGVTDAAAYTSYYGQAVDLNPKASKEGKRFAGWNTDPNAKYGYMYLEMPASDITLYAIYSIPVSDIKEVYLAVWGNDDVSTIRTYPLTRTGEYNMTYEYTLNTIDVADVFAGQSLTSYIYAWDYAGNYSETLIQGNPVPVPPIITTPYKQVVEHYRYDNFLNDWVLFATISEDKHLGELYEPAFIEPPAGYQPTTIDSAYVVADNTVSKAYYSPISYTLYFNANGGSSDIESKPIVYGDYYGELPTAVREGYTFLGWYTEAVNGEKVLGSNKYQIKGDSTVYAHWEVNKHMVIYDYETNGGTNVSTAYKETAYGTDVDLSVTAIKEGWDFVGWNTDPNATEGLSSITMKDTDLILYAIYKNDITAVFIDSGETRYVTDTIYNNELEGSILVPVQNTMGNWTSLGWSMDTKADASIDAASGSTINLAKDTTFYGVYEKEIAVSYDTNGSAEEIEVQKGNCFYNASGEEKFAEIIIANAPTLENNSFVIWEELDAAGKVLNSYEPSQSVLFNENKMLTARWDKYPEIEAFDRYFTLEDALNGKITETVLLEKVKATDFEDGTLENGTDVIVKDYDPSDYTSETEVNITYEATDSFGNKVEQTITVYVVDTTLTKVPILFYSRFISKDFYSNDAGLISAEYGGLENTSIWRTDETYSRLLESSMYNSKIDEEYKIIDTFGSNIEVKVAGSGEWEHTEETWSFTKEDIEAIKEFVNEHGYGNIKEPGAIDLFYEKFGRCRQ